MQPLSVATPARVTAQPPTRRRSLPRLLARVLAVVLILAAVSYLAIGGYIVSKLTRTERQAQSATPGDLNLPYEDVRFAARDGLTLAGWFIPASGSDRVVILVHGKGENRSTEFDGRFLEVARGLHAAGFNVLTIDMRGHGDSAGERFTLGEHERWDVLGATDWLQQRGFTRIGALGVSMGAAAVAGAAADPQGGQAIRAVVLDSAFSNIRELLDREFPKASGLPNAFLPGALFMGRVLYHANLNAIRPVDDLPRIHAPLMLIHGGQDTGVPLGHFCANAAARRDAETWLVPGAEHARGYNTQPDEYITRVSAFFDRALR